MLDGQIQLDKNNKALALTYKLYLSPQDLGADVAVKRTKAIHHRHHHAVELVNKNHTSD